MKDFIFGTSLKASMCKGVCFETAEKLWKGFTFGCSELELSECDDFSFTVGDCERAALQEDCEYAVRVDERGVSIVAKDESCLMRGFCALLMYVDYLDLEKDIILKIPQLDLSGKYLISERMIHLCIFPETDFYFLKKMIRLAGVLQYTHVVLEFWGTFPFDCLAELCWSEHHYTKEQISELVREIRRFGMEPVPMFNHLGHAPGARGGVGGKHTVLDQNPRLQYLFTHDGWSFDIRKDSVKQLHRNIRRELYEAFGDGRYIHIGFDEAPTYYLDKSMRALLPKHLSYLTGEIVAEGRRPLIWLDMFLTKELNKTVGPYGCTEEESLELLSSLHPETVGVDWEYESSDIPKASSVYFKEHIKDIVGASWYKAPNIRSHIETAKQLGLRGAMLTTWHMLSSRANSILIFAIKAGAVTFPWTSVSEPTEETSTLLRKISFEGNDYHSAGWKREQIEV